jgi:DNA-binding PadR family transcriptional regulator
MQPDLVPQIISALQSYGLKQEGRGKYRCKSSPFRPGSDSNSFTVSVDGDQLVWHDHKDNRGGGMIELAQALHIDIPRHQAAETKRGYRDMAEYAESHGIPVTVLKSAMWREVTLKGRAALEFPTPSGRRWRFIDGQQPYYISETGYKACWYGADTPIVRGAIDTNQPIVICNGEISTVAAQHWYVPAICMTSGEKGKIPDDLFAQMKQGVPATVPIIIALDCDDKGRASARGLYQQLALHYKAVKVVDLNMSKGGDLADFVSLHREKSAAALGALPAVNVPAAPRQRIPDGIVIGNVGQAVFIKAKDVYKLPPVEWIIPGEIPHRGLTVLYGPSGAGKSFVALDYCLSIAQHSNVVYIAGEGESGLAPRIRAWCNYHSKSEARLILGLGAINFIDTGELETLIELLSKDAPKLLVVDTLARSMADSDENMTRDMNIFMTRCKHVMDALDCAMMLIHHTGKNGGEYRGSSSLRGAADSMIAVEDEDDIIRIESRKSKDATPFPTRYVRFEQVDTGLVDANGMPLPPTPVLVATTPNDDSAVQALTKWQRRVLESAASEIYRETGIRYSEVKEIVTGLSHQTLTRALGALKKKGYVSQEQKGDCYTITPDGLGVLGIETTDDTHDTHVTHASHIGVTGKENHSPSVIAERTALNVRTVSDKSRTKPPKGGRNLFGDNVPTHYDYEDD